FFQAEDGIRDLIVTGVQTCALPICEEWLTDERFATRRARFTNARELIAELDAIFATKPLEAWAELFAAEPDFFWSPVNTVDDLRSEERRVGKEWRARWARGQQRKKK